MKKLSDSGREMCDCLSASRLWLASEINPLDGGYSRLAVLGSRPWQSRTLTWSKVGSDVSSQRLCVAPTWFSTCDLQDQEDAAKGPIQ